MKPKIIFLILATVTTGIMAGIFFTWTNAVTPGIGELEDMLYLSSLQSMNRVILNPIFQGLFIAAALLFPLALLFNIKSSPKSVVWLLAIGMAIYEVGAVGVTFLGNIPLNEILDDTVLASISLEEAAILRGSIEAKWNGFNLIRTLSSTLSFILLIAAFLPLLSQTQRFGCSEKQPSFTPPHPSPDLHSLKTYPR